MVNGLSRWDGNGFLHFTLSEDLNYDAVFCLLEDQNGAIWVGTEDGAKVWDGKGFRQYSTKEGLCNNTVLSLLEDRHGNIWIGTGNGLSVWNGRGFTNYLETDGLGSSFVVNALEEDAKGKVWIGTENGLFVYAPEAERQRNGFTHYTTKEGLSHNFVQALYAEPDGGVWVGTKNGLNHLQPFNDKEYTIQYYSHDNGLRGQMIRNILLDRKNRLWLSGNKGLDQVALNQYKRDSVQPTLILREVQPFFEQVDWRQLQKNAQNDEGATTGEQQLPLASIHYDSVQAFSNLPVDPGFSLFH